MSRLDLLKSILAKEKINHKKNILFEPSFKGAHSYCKIHNLGGPQLGSLLEYYLITRKKFTKNNSSLCTGDFSLKYENKTYNIEFKASLGGQKHNQFNFGQIRLNHLIQFYFFSAYHLSHINVNKGGELFMFLLNKENLKKIIYEFGHYSHGTTSKNGKITYKDLEDVNNCKEYSLRPAIGSKCWEKLESFRIKNVVVERPKATCDLRSLDKQDTISKKQEVLLKQEVLDYFAPNPSMLNEKDITNIFNKYNFSKANTRVKDTLDNQMLTGSIVGKKRKFNN